MKIAISKIKPSPFQVRSRLNGQLLVELKESMNEVGQIVPIKVRPTSPAYWFCHICSDWFADASVPLLVHCKYCDHHYPLVDEICSNCHKDLNEGECLSEPNEYEIVYGHRRFESAQQLGWETIEASVSALTDKQVKIQALIENVQRDDLEPLDEAQGYFNLWRRGDGDMTQEEIAKEIGRSDFVIRTMLALLNIPDDIKPLLSSGRDIRAQGMPEGPMPGSKMISPRHVMVAKTVGESCLSNVLKKASEEGLTVAQTQRVAKSIAAAPTDKAKEKLLEWEYSPSIHDPDMIESRAEKHGAHDQFYQDKEPAAEEQWMLLPEVAAILDQVKGWKGELKAIKDTAEIGKMAPEAKQFIARKLTKHADACYALAKELEGKDD